LTDMHAVIEKALALSKADAAIVIGERGSNANVRWANNTSTTNGVADSATLHVISIIDRAVGVISRSFFPDDHLEDLVRESEAACEGKPAASDHMALLEGDGPPGDWEAPADQTGINVFDEVTPDLAAMFSRAGEHDLRTFGYAEHDTTTIWLGTSTGLRLRDTKADGKIECTAKSADLSRSAWTGRVSSTFTDVDLKRMFERVEQRLSWSDRTIEMPPGRYEVILEPAATADMALYAYVMGSAREADEGRTVFSKPGGGNRIGEKLYADGVTIYSDPTEPGFETLPFSVALGSSSYSSVFDNGLPLRRTDWVRNGVLDALITTRHWAERSGGSAVTPFVPNLIFAGNQGPSTEEMIARTKRGLLVTCFWYIRLVDPQSGLLTGLTRDGVYLVEDGEVKGAVNNFRYNMSPVQMFANAIEIGRPEPTLPREFEFALTRMPALRVRDFHMSSVSDAT